MIEIFIILITGFVVIFILIHILLHFYFKQKRKLFFAFMQNKNYIYLRNVDTDIETKSRLSYRFIYKKADIIFFEDKIFILILNRLISNGEILQIGKENTVFPGALRNLIYTSRSKTGENLKIKGYFNRGVLNHDFIISINFKNKDFDIDSIL